LLHLLGYQLVFHFTSLKTLNYGPIHIVLGWFIVERGSYFKVSVGVG
jgi:hypothetical protein